MKHSRIYLFLVLFNNVFSTARLYEEYLKILIYETKMTLLSHARSYVDTFFELIFAT